MRAPAALVAGQILLAGPIAAQTPPPGAPPAMTAPIAINAEGLIANLYLPERSGPAPAIMLLGGSEGGLGPGADRQSLALAGHGYVVLQVSYFGSPGQPPALKNIPLETFSRALDWLGRQPRVDPARIGVMGTSKGAEAALLTASRHPELKIAVVGVPSNVAWAGINPAGMEIESSWTEAGKPVPFMPYGWTGTWKGIRALYEDGMASAAAHQDALIPVERINGPVFMVCGEADTLWPSCPMARAARDRLAAAHFTYPVTLLAYADAGHAVFGVPVAKTNPAYASLASLGGSADGNAEAREDAWPKALAALDAALMNRAKAP